MEVLRMASFRGVPFFVKQADVTIGRRTQLHEYPQRDKPFVEDLGRMARTFSVNGFVAGKDYMNDWRALQGAFEKEGSGELIHPWYGRLSVNVTSGVNVSFSTALGIVEFTASFTEAGELEFPSRENDTKQKTVMSAARLRSAGLDSFASRFDLTNAQDFVRDTVARHVKELFSDQLVLLSGVVADSEVSGRIADQAMTLVSGDPKVFGSLLLDALDLGDISRSVGNWRSAANKCRLFADDDRLNTNESKRHPIGSSERIAAESQEVFNEFVRTIEINNAVLATTNIATANDRMNESDPVKAMSYDEIVELRDGLLETIEREQTRVASDELFQALGECRAAVWEDLSKRAENNAKLFEYTPNSPMPALVLAYDVYEDARRDIEIVERNHVPRGGFLPARPLKLLSK